MKKVALLFVFALLFSTTGYSQWSATVGGGAGLPMGDLKTNYNTGFGFSGALNYELQSTPVELSITSGFDQMPNKSTSDIKYQFLQFFGGAKYLFKTPGSKFTPYVAGRIGLISVKVDITVGGTTFSGTSDSQFAWSPQAGFRYGFSPTLALDVNAYYISSSKSGMTLSWLGIQAGVNFGW